MRAKKYEPERFSLVLEVTLLLSPCCAPTRLFLLPSLVQYLVLYGHLLFPYCTNTGRLALSMTTRPRCCPTPSLSLSLSLSRSFFFLYLYIAFLSFLFFLCVCVRSYFSSSQIMHISFLLTKPRPTVHRPTVCYDVRLSRYDRGASLSWLLL